MDRKPRERRRASTRQAIVDAARRLIVERGIDGLSMRTLAEAIDYSPSAIYKYFRSKGEIVDAIRAEGFRLSAAMAAAEEDPRIPPAERFFAAGMRYQRFAKTYPEHYLLMFATPGGRPLNVSDILEEPGFVALVENVRQAAASGELRLPRPYAAEDMALHFWFLSHGVAMLRLTIMRAAGAEFEALSGRVMRVFIDSLTARSGEPD